MADGAGRQVPLEELIQQLQRQRSLWPTAWLAPVRAKTYGRHFFFNPFLALYAERGRHCKHAVTYVASIREVRQKKCTQWRECRLLTVASHGDHREIRLLLLLPGLPWCKALLTMWAWAAPHSLWIMLRQGSLTNRANLQAGACRGNCAPCKSGGNVSALLPSGWASARAASSCSRPMVLRLSQRMISRATFRAARADSPVDGIPDEGPSQGSYRAAMST